MRSIIFNSTLLFVLVSMLGCAGQLTVQKLPPYEAAIQIGGSERPKLFYDKSVQIESAMTPYALIIARGGGGDKNQQAKNLWRKAAELKADVVIVSEGGQQYAGATSTAIPLGHGAVTALAMPMYTNTYYAYCYRLNPVRLGFQANDSNMILKIYNDNLRDSGILEGDIVMSINGFTYDAKRPMPEMLTLRKDEDVIISVIRPGIGKIDRKVRPGENKPTYINYSDAVDWENAKSAYRRDE